MRARRGTGQGVEVRVGVSFMRLGQGGWEQRRESMAGWHISGSGGWVLGGLDEGAVCGWEKGDGCVRRW